MMTRIHSKINAKTLNYVVNIIYLSSKAPSSFKGYRNSNNGYLIKLFFPELPIHPSIFEAFDAICLLQLKWQFLEFAYVKRALQQEGSIKTTITLTFKGPLSV